MEEDGSPKGKGGGKSKGQGKGDGGKGVVEGGKGPQAEGGKGYAEGVEGKGSKGNDLELAPKRRAAPAEPDVASSSEERAPRARRSPRSAGRAPRRGRSWAPERKAHRRHEGGRPHERTHAEAGDGDGGHREGKGSKGHRLTPRCPICWRRVGSGSGLSQHQYWSVQCNAWKLYNMSKAQAKKEDMDLLAAEAGPAGRKGGGNAEKAQAQAAKRMQAANSKLAQEAGKWIAPLRKVPDALGKVLTQAQKAGERFQGTQEDLDLLEELMRKAQLRGDATSRTLLLDKQNKDAEKAGVASTPLEPLPFGGKDAKLFQKQAQAAAAAVRGNIRKKEAPARQGGGDDPAPKRRRKCKGGA